LPRKSDSTRTPGEANSTELSNFELADLLGIQLTRLYVLIRRPLADSDVSQPRMRMLYNLLENGPQRISDLAVADNVSQPSATAMVRGLAEAGLVERRVDATDGRAVLVAITPAGEKQLKERRAIRAKALADRLDELPASRRRELERALGSLTHLADQLSS
jgi:DNA-binding MarR family transcriptional regulator